MPSTQYFEKVENGTLYRIYLYEFENDVAPMLVRSSLDACDGVHGELTERINNTIDADFDELIEKDLGLNLTYEQRHLIASKACRRSMIFELENMGWTFYEDGEAA